VGIWKNQTLIVQDRIVTDMLPIGKLLIPCSDMLVCSVNILWKQIWHLPNLPLHKVLFLLGFELMSSWSEIRHSNQRAS
jgi:hypothetical protein